MSKALILSLAMGSAFMLQQCEGDLSAPVFVSSGKIQVIDGDTISIDHIRHRLVGYDTPETFQARCEEERSRGLLATVRLQHLIFEGGGLTLRSQKRTDKYGRMLSVAEVNGAGVAETLISEGLARPYNGGKRGSWCADGEAQ